MNGTADGVCTSRLPVPTSSLSHPNSFLPIRMRWRGRLGWGGTYSWLLAPRYNWAQAICRSPGPNCPADWFQVTPDGASPRVAALVPW